MVIEAFSHLWMRSTGLACGCEPVVLTLVLPSLAISCLTSSETKEGSRSDTRSFGNPNFVPICISASTTDFIFLLVIGMAKGYLEKTSMHVKIQL